MARMSPRRARGFDGRRWDVVDAVGPLAPSHRGCVEPADWSNTSDSDDETTPSGAVQVELVENARHDNIGPVVQARTYETDVESHLDEAMEVYYARMNEYNWSCDWVSDASSSDNFNNPNAFDSDEDTVSERDDTALTLKSEHIHSCTLFMHSIEFPSTPFVVCPIKSAKLF